jgi:broad specificity phosphatase PhoE
LELEEFNFCRKKFEFSYHKQRNPVYEMPCPKFILIRHGEATHNVAFQERGEGAFIEEQFRDAPLTEKGIQQAKNVARELSNYNIIDIWSSPLTRTIQTAEELIEETSAQRIYLHDNLIECLGGNHHCNERLSKEILKEKYPYFDTKLLPDLPSFHKNRESLTSVKYRMMAIVFLLAHIYNDCPDDSYLLIVTHRDAIFSLLQMELHNVEYVITDLEEILKK